MYRLSVVVVKLFWEHKLKSLGVRRRLDKNGEQMLPAVKVEAGRSARRASDQPRRDELSEVEWTAPVISDHVAPRPPPRTKRLGPNQLTRHQSPTSDSLEDLERNYD
jgi:hypothetical protein